MNKEAVRALKSERSAHAKAIKTLDAVLGKLTGGKKSGRRKVKASRKAKAKASAGKSARKPKAESEAEAKRRRAAELKAERAGSAGRITEPE